MHYSEEKIQAGPPPFLFSPALLFFHPPTPPYFIAMVGVFFTLLRLPNGSLALSFPPFPRLSFGLPLFHSARYFLIQKGELWMCLFSWWRFSFFFSFCDSHRLLSFLWRVLSLPPPSKTLSWIQDLFTTSLPLFPFSSPLFVLVADFPL